MEKMSYGDRLTESQMLRFVEIYRKQECLWNVNSKYYKDRKVRQQAYKTMCCEMNLPGLLPRDIPKKIKNLRSSYHHEKKKIDLSLSSGVQVAYEPKVAWFSQADEFLKAFSQRPDVFSNLSERNSKTDDCSSNEDYEEGNLETEDTISEVEQKFDISQLNGDSQESDNDEHGAQVFTNPVRKRKFITRPVFASSIQPPLPRVRILRKQSKQADISEAVAKIDVIAEKLKSQIIEDEFDIFGKYIALTLRSLPSEISISAKTELQKTLSEFQLKAIRDASFTKK